MMFAAMESLEHNFICNLKQMILWIMDLRLICYSSINDLGYLSMRRGRGYASACKLTFPSVLYQLLPRWQVIKTIWQKEQVV